jgi:hypothetical protein
MLMKHSKSLNLMSLLGVALAGLLLLGLQPVAVLAAPAPAATAKPVAVVAKPAKQVTPLQLVRTPEAYLNQAVKFDAEFSGFSGLGLDYKKAYRDAKDYVTVLVRRPDVQHHSIPLSELKLFYPRKQSEALGDLEPGDALTIEGTVFSTALREPWVDITSLKVIKAAKPAAKTSPKP